MSQFEIIVENLTCHSFVSIISWIPRWRIPLYSRSALNYNEEIFTCSVRQRGKGASFSANAEWSAPNIIEHVSVNNVAYAFKQFDNELHTQRRILWLIEQTIWHTVAGFFFSLPYLYTGASSYTPARLSAKHDHMDSSCSSAIYSRSHYVIITGSQLLNARLHIIYVYLRIVIE